jgi:hypothetical protein
VYSFSSITTVPAGLSTSFITDDLANKQVSFSMVTNSAFIGQYSITLTGVISLNSPNVGNTDSVDQTFILNVKSCTDTTGNIVLSDSSPGTPGATDYFISSGTSTVTFPALSYSGTTNCAASDIVYTLTSTDSFLIGFDASTRTVSISSSSTSDLGAHTVTVRGEITAPSATGTKFVDRSFTLTIKQCSQSTSSYTLVDSDSSSPSATRTYFVLQAEDTITFSPISYSSTSSDCQDSDITYSFTITPPAGVTDTSFFTQDVPNYEIKFSTSDRALIGAYTIDFVGTLNTVTP